MAASDERCVAAQPPVAALTVQYVGVRLASDFHEIRDRRGWCIGDTGSALVAAVLSLKRHRVGIDYLGFGEWLRAFHHL